VLLANFTGDEQVKTVDEGVKDDGAPTMFVCQAVVMPIEAVTGSEIGVP
jgi:hypothetical protein